MQTSPPALAEIALMIGREAGALALAGRENVHLAGTKSSPIDLVTKMDQDCEALIKQRLHDLRPGEAFLGEESGQALAPEPGSVRWVVDPIDGTVNYFYGQPSWCVAIAAEVDGIAIAGAVVAPALGEEYTASLGGGSYRVDHNRKVQLACSQQEDLEFALVATGFGYRRERRVEQGRVVAALVPDVRDLRRCGAAALDLCWVGSGRVDAQFERGLNPWDRAAAGLVASEAGAVVAGLRGAVADQDMTLAANPTLFAKLDTRLTQLNADGRD
ncbi:inositol monophosphatase [Candidatus Nanopelagicales bacterium]|nr:inositol monophosphatase [Candidatus Nanopelagicales bacterium]